MALSPWPKSPAALKSATATLRQALGLGENTSDPFAFDHIDTDVQRTAGAVAARIEHYAADAPQPVKNEALVRMVAWLSDTAGAARYFRPDNRNLARRVGGTEHAPITDWQPAPIMSDRALRSSGAMALLAPWRDWEAT